MDSKRSIDRAKSRRPLDIAKERKLLRKGTKIEERGDKQEFLKSDSFLRKNPIADTVRQEKSAPISDSPILSPETSIALDNAEQVMQNALLEIKQLNAAQSRSRKGGIRLRVHEPSFDDEVDQLLYVRERVAAKLHDIDSGINPAQDTRKLKVDARFLRNFANNADRFAMGLGSLDKTDGKPLHYAPREPAAGDSTTANSHKKPSADESRAVKDRSPGSPVQKIQRKMEGFSIQPGTSVNIERELKAQKLQDIHISPDPSFVLDAPNIATFNFEYGTDSRKAAPKTRVRMIKMGKEGDRIYERTNDEPNEFRCDEDKISVDLSAASENKESLHSEISNSNIHVIPDGIEARLSGACTNKRVLRTPEEDGLGKRDDADLVDVQKNNRRRNFYSTQLAAKDRIGKSNQVNCLRDREAENDRERERHKTIDHHFRNILENYTDRKECLIDASYEDVPTPDEVDLYQPSMAELDTVIAAYNKAIKRIVRGIRSVEQFLSDKKMAQYRSAGNQLLDQLDQCTLDNLLVSHQGTIESRIPSSLAKQREAMCHSLTHKQIEVSRNNVWPVKVTKRRQPKAREVEHKFVPCKQNYGTTDLPRGSANPKTQVGRNDRLFRERTMKFKFDDNRECFTENTNPPGIDIANGSGFTSESMYTDDDDVKIGNLSPDRSKDPEGKREYQGTLGELVMKMKDSTKTIEHFRKSLQSIESENVKRLFESELKRKEMNPEIIRSIIKNLEEYVRDLQDPNDAASKTGSKHDCETTLTIENNSQVLSEIQQECNTIEKRLNESQASRSLHSANVNNSVKTLVEENASNKVGRENKENNSGKSVTSSSRKKTLSLPMHESSRIDNKAGKLINSDVRSLEDISFIKPSNRSSVAGNPSVRESKRSLPKAMLDSAEIQSLRPEENSDRVKQLSAHVKIVSKPEGNDVIRQKGSSMHEAGEQLSSADSLRDCPSLSASIDDKPPTPKSSSQPPPSPSMKPNSVRQSERTSSQNRPAECPAAEVLPDAHETVAGNKLQQPSEEKSVQVDIINERPFKAPSLSEASHSEGEICLSSSYSFSLGEVRRATPRKSESVKKDIENDIIFVARPVQPWNVSSDSQSESPGEI